MAAILDFCSRRRRAVRSHRTKSGLVDSVGIAVIIATPSLAVQKLLPLPVWLSVILNFGSLPSSTNVGQRRQTSGSVLSVKSKSDVVENVGGSFWNRVANNYRSKVISSSGLVAAILNP